MSIEEKILALGFETVTVQGNTIKATVTRGGHVCGFAVRSDKEIKDEAVALFKDWLGNLAGEEHWKEPRSPSFDELKRDK